LWWQIESFGRQLSNPKTFDPTSFRYFDFRHENPGKRISGDSAIVFGIGAETAKPTFFRAKFAQEFTGLKPQRRPYRVDSAARVWLC